MLHVEIWPEFDNIDEEGKPLGYPVRHTGWVVTEYYSTEYNFCRIGRFEPGEFQNAMRLADKRAKETGGEVRWCLTWKR